MLWISDFTLFFFLGYSVLIWGNKLWIKSSSGSSDVNCRVDDVSDLFNAGKRHFSNTVIAPLCLFERSPSCLHTSMLFGWLVAGSAWLAAGSAWLVAGSGWLNARSGWLNAGSAWLISGSAWLNAWSGWMLGTDWLTARDWLTDLLCFPLAFFFSCHHGLPNPFRHVTSSGSCFHERVEEAHDGIVLPLFVTLGCWSTSFFGLSF